MDVVCFKLSGRFAHFLYAEANRDMPSYPVPPRTALLGMAGAIIGLEKDTPQDVLEPAMIAVASKMPERFWLKNKFHQSLPTPLPYKITRSQKGGGSEIKNQKMLTQEWLFNPAYEIYMSLPSKYHGDFAARIKQNRCHFQPCLGISEHLAKIEWTGNEIAETASAGVHHIYGVFPESSGEILMDDALKESLALHFLRMPACLSKDRVFMHRNYYFERCGKAIPVKTDQAFLIRGKKIIFM